MSKPESEPKEKGIGVGDDLEWENVKSMEETVKNLIRSGRETEIVPILENLPTALKLKYRRIWKEEKEKMKAEGVSK